MSIFSQSKMVVICGCLFGAILFGTILLSGCSSTSRNAEIAGKYVDVDVSSIYVEFNPDGTCALASKYYRHEGTYEVIGNTIRACWSNSDKKDQKMCDEFTISGNQLIQPIGNGQYSYYKKIQ